MAAKPIRILVAGGGMLILGWALIFLMAVDVLPLSYALAFLAYVLCLAGFAAGMYGLVELRRRGEEN